MVYLSPEDNYRRCVERAPDKEEGTPGRRAAKTQEGIEFSDEKRLKG